MSPRKIVQKSPDGLKRAIFCLLPFLIIFLHSCSPARIAISPDVVQKYNLQEEDLRGLLFFSGNTIRITREVDQNFRLLISDNKLVRRGGKTYEVITIRKGSPGILGSVHGDSIMVSFSRHDHILFVPCSMSNNYTTALKAEKGMLRAGNQYYTCSGSMKLTIDSDTYRKFSLPRYFAQEW